jgi:hypothetical protein
VYGVELSHAALSLDHRRGVQQFGEHRCSKLDYKMAAIAKKGETSRNGRGMGNKTINRKHRVGCPTCGCRKQHRGSRARVAAGGVQVEAAVVRRCCDRRDDDVRRGPNPLQAMWPFAASVHTRVAPNCVQYCHNTIHVEPRIGFISSMVVCVKVD